MKCEAEGCDKQAGRRLRLCWKHDYLKRYWTNPAFRERRKATKRVYGRRRLQVKRDRIAEALGGWSCVLCGNTDRDVLTFDHTNGGGEAERRRRGGQFPTMNHYYMHPDEARRNLRVLCANCNWRQNTIDERRIKETRSADGRKSMWLELIDLLGGPRCSGCGERDIRVLTLDHIQGGGTADRRLHGGHPQMIRYYFTHTKEASQKLAILCRNCNWKKHRTRAGKRYLA